ncbi:MAG: hypothetical protein ABFD52_09050 [Acidobacteriota bacterium]
MAKGTLVFVKVFQNSQDLGTDDDHLVSRVFYDLETPTGTLAGLFSDVKLTPGADFSQDPLEVSYPEELNGILGYGILRPLVERYYRANIGETGSGIRIGPGCKGIVMRDNTCIMRMAFPVELTSTGKVGW